MKAVILAAGRGTRLVPMGWDKPKCMLQFGNQTLLDSIIISLLENNIDRITIVVGHKHELVLESLRKHPVKCDVVLNSDYAETNTINSLYLAREHLNEDFLYFNADILFDRRIVSMLLACDGSAFAIDEKSCGQEEVKVIVDSNGRIVRIGKSLKCEECRGEFIGICKFSRSACQDLVASLCNYNEKLNERNLFFEAAVDDILQKHTIMASPIGELLAIEIDFPNDYLAARELWESGQMSS